MRITTTQALFAWEGLKDSPSLQTLREFLAAVPDAKLLDSLRQRRGKGRDDDLVSCCRARECQPVLRAATVRWDK